jgi:hypothetical protein
LFLWVLLLLITATLVSFFSLGVIRIVTSFASVVLSVINSILLQAAVLDSAASHIIILSLFIPFRLVIMKFYEVH